VSPFQKISSFATTATTSNKSRNHLHNNNIPNALLPALQQSTQNEIESDTTSNDSTTEKSLVRRNYSTFSWQKSSKSKSYNINYRTEGNPNNPPILLVHGFGANVNHFRYNIPVLEQKNYHVIAIDLLGFGASDKPKEEVYSIDLWVDLLCDFIEYIKEENVNKSDQPFVICGNSIGGLCSLAVSARVPSQVRGLVFFNCAGGMTGFRYEELPFYIWPVLFFFQKVVFGPLLGGLYFTNFKTRQNVQSILINGGVYRDTTNVNEELLEVLLGPSDDEGAQEVFLKVFGGDAGPTPESLLPKVECPILALWGDDDPWVPADKGNHPAVDFDQYVKEGIDFKLVLLENTGHCPHDECPSKVHDELLPWLDALDSY